MSVGVACRQETYKELRNDLIEAREPSSRAHILQCKGIPVDRQAILHTDVTKHNEMVKELVNTA